MMTRRESEETRGDDDGEGSVRRKGVVLVSEHHLVKATREALVNDLIENLPEVKAIREREPTAEEVARFAEIQMDKLSVDQVKACQALMDLTKRYKTSFWFHMMLDERQRKSLLCLLHDARTALEDKYIITNEGVRSFDHFLKLLHRLEEEHQQYKDEQRATGQLVNEEEA